MRAATAPVAKRRSFDYLDGGAGSAPPPCAAGTQLQLRQRREAEHVDLEAIARRLRQHGTVECNEFILRTQINDGNRRYENHPVSAERTRNHQGTSEPGVGSQYLRPPLGS